MNTFFRLKAKRDKLLADFNKIEDYQARNNITFDIKDTENAILGFVNEFKTAPHKFFTGRGFFTFRNYQYAILIQSIYNKAFGKAGNVYLNKRAVNNIKRMKSLIYREVIKPSENSISDDNALKTDMNKTASETIGSDTRDQSTYVNEQYQTNLNEIKNQKKHRYSQRIIQNLSNLFIFDNVKDIDVEKEKKMISFLGPNIKLKRGTDISSLNFDYSQKRPIDGIEITLYIILFMIFFPSIAYYFNYKYFHYFIISNLEQDKGISHMITQNFYVILTVVVDQVSFILIELFFNKSRFFKTSTMYKYTIYFSCFYMLLSDVVYPNFAMKKIFTSVSASLSLKKQQELLKQLIKSLYTNYGVVLFSGLNSKVVNPYIVNRFILKRTKKRNDNSMIVFGLSYLIVCVFNVAFFGTITPLIFVIFFVFVSCILILDYMTIMNQGASTCVMRPETRSMKLKMTEAFDAGQFSEKKDLNFIDKPKMTIEELLSIEPAVKNDDENLPITLFVNAVLILIVGIFLLSYLGYFGITKDFVDVLNKEHEPPLHWFWKAVYHGKSVIRKIHSFIDDSVNPLPSFTKDILNTIISTLYNILKRTLIVLIEDSYFFVYCVIYAISTLGFFIFYNNQRFINRMQNRIWAKQKTIENVEFKGLTYREANPAYKLLNFGN